jgi:hypothetical protein
VRSSILILSYATRKLLSALQGIYLALQIKEFITITALIQRAVSSVMLTPISQVAGVQVIIRILNVSFLEQLL